MKIVPVEQYCSYSWQERGYVNDNDKGGRQISDLKESNDFRFRYREE
jgi:hypothetical protein